MVAETASDLVGRAVAGEPSMGPRPRGRGKLISSSRARRRCSLLQWGRDLVVAETERRRAPPSSATSTFNGAATSWSRKLPGADGRRRGGLRLQWGRDLVVAETAMSLETKVYLFILQWGRDLVVAETAK